MKDLSDSSHCPALFMVALCQIRRLPLRRAQPTLPVLNALLASSLRLGTVLALGTAQAAPASPLNLIGGSVEVQSQVRKGQPVSTALRTRTGRAVLSGPSSGRLTLGSNSLMQVYNNQPDMQSGRFYIVGAAQLYAFGTHLHTQGQMRLDASSGPVQRVAVIAGTLRLSPDGQAFTLKAGQQYGFLTGNITSFRKSDPWYLSQFIGEGDAALQASRGSVLTGPTPEQFRSAVIGQLLASGSRLKTEANAWAELGFSGGGYLRLQADSHLRVLGVETTSRGREVLLQLETGSAWNVVQKGVGGYQLSTPTVTTAVRGTIFRVDTSGLVKVFSGAVSLPSQGDAVIAQGAQRETAGRLGGLNLTVTSNPWARVSVSLGGRDVPVSAENGAFTLQEALPESRYTLVVRAARPEQTLELTQSLIINRTPPVISVSMVSRGGATLTITGAVSDNFAALPLLRAEVGGQVYTLHASGPFSWALPVVLRADMVSRAERQLKTLALSAADEAGNRTDALLS